MGDSVVRSPVQSRLEKEASLFFHTHVVGLDVLVCVFYPVVHDNNRDPLAGHVVLPHPRDVYVHAFIVDVVLVEETSE